MAAPPPAAGRVDGRVLSGLAARQAHEEEAGQASVEANGQSAFRLHGWLGLPLHSVQGWQI